MNLVDRADLGWMWRINSTWGAKKKRDLWFMFRKFFGRRGIKIQYTWIRVRFMLNCMVWRRRICWFMKERLSIEYFIIFHWAVVGSILCSIVLNILKPTQTSNSKWKILIFLLDPCYSITLFTTHLHLLLVDD